MGRAGGAPRVHETSMIAQTFLGRLGLGEKTMFMHVFTFFPKSSHAFANESISPVHRAGSPRNTAGAGPSPGGSCAVAGFASDRAWLAIPVEPGAAHFTHGAAARASEPV